MSDSSRSAREKYEEPSPVMVDNLANSLKAWRDDGNSWHVIAKGLIRDYFPPSSSPATKLSTQQAEAIHAILSDPRMNEPSKCRDCGEPLPPSGDKREDGWWTSGTLLDNLWLCPKCAAPKPSPATEEKSVPYCENEAEHGMRNMGFKPVDKPPVQEQEVEELLVILRKLPIQDGAWRATPDEVLRPVAVAANALMRERQEPNHLSHEIMCPQSSSPGDGDCDCHERIPYLRDDLKAAESRAEEMEKALRSIKALPLGCLQPSGMGGDCCPYSDDAPLCGHCEIARILDRALAGEAKR